ncbi:hypothetical protein C8F00_2669 [Xanthomonas vasicola]
MTPRRWAQDCYAAVAQARRVSPRPTRPAAEALTIGRSASARAVGGLQYVHRSGPAHPLRAQCRGGQGVLPNALRAIRHRADRQEWVVLAASGIELALHRVGEAYRQQPDTRAPGSAVTAANTATNWCSPSPPICSRISSSCSVPAYLLANSNAMPALLSRCTTAAIRRARSSRSGVWIRSSEQNAANSGHLLVDGMQSLQRPRGA